MRKINIAILFFILTSYACKDKDECTHCPEYQVWKNDACECEKGTYSNYTLNGLVCRPLAVNEWLLGENECDCIENKQLIFGTIHDAPIGNNSEIDIVIGGFGTGAITMLQKYDSVNFTAPMSYIVKDGECNSNYKGFEMIAILAKDRTKVDLTFKFYNKSWPPYDGLKVEKECSFTLTK